MRYDEEKQIYRDCKFCHGKGCLACKTEADKAYKREFPDGPKPIATFRKDSPGDMEKLKKVFGVLALNSVFGDGGGGIKEILSNLAKAEDTGDSKDLVKTKLTSDIKEQIRDMVAGEYC